jgi:type II secretory pathway component PulF
MKLSNELNERDNLKNKIKSVFNYPFIIFSFLFVALFIVLIFVIPKLKELFTIIDGRLPLSTQLLI